MSARVWLGTHQVNWLWTGEVPDLMVSRNRLLRIKTWRPAKTDWVLDSGGFTELAQHGHWRMGPEEYVEFVGRCVDEIGRLVWAAPQDWMCEPFMLDKTGLTVRDHQRFTLHNYRDLRDLAPDLPIIPVLQGWQPVDYLRHADDYERAGFDLTAERVVGVGSVCRRQATESIIDVLGPLARRGYRTHAFGAKKSAAPVIAGVAASMDSLAWSFRARYGHIRLDGCTHQTCANCPRWAVRWRAELDRKLEHWQPTLEMSA